MPVMSNDQMERLLTDIQDQLKAVYPLESPCDVDARYAFGVGLILGVLAESFNAVREDRPMELKFTVGSIQPPGDKVVIEDVAAIGEVSRTRRVTIPLGIPTEEEK